MSPESESVAGEIEARIFAFVRANDLLSPDKTVVVGVSGGADSICLMYSLHRLRDQLPLGIHVAYLDHMLRGVESREEAAFVARQAADLGLGCSLDEADVSAFSRSYGVGLEEAGRLLRYGFLRDVAVRIGASCVATGHTRDDSVETVLMNVMRGAGIRGLRGLEPASRLPLPLDFAVGPSQDAPTLVRPLLALSRRDTERYCGALGLDFRRDASNESPEFLRNRVRHELLPLLRGMNAGVDDALLRLAAAAREDDDLLAKQTDELWERAAETAASHLYLSNRRFAAAAPSLQARLVMRAVEFLAGSTHHLTTAHIRAVVALSRAGGGKSVRVARGIEWRREGDRLLAFAPGADPATEDALMPVDPVELAIPGLTSVAGWRVSVVVTDSVAAVVGDTQTAVLDAERVGPVLTVRRRRPGDRMQPLGMDGGKKLQDIMVDCRLPAMVRDRVPVVCAGEDIVWVVGCRLSERFKVTPGTRSFLVLSFVHTCR